MQSKLKVMQMSLKILLIKNKLKKYLKDKEILDIIVFGSFIKGKADAKDIDIAIITEKNLSLNLNGFHVSIIKPKEFFVNPPSLINTLLREGFSLKNNKSFSQLYEFSNKVLFTYRLENLNASEKVKVVSILRGKNGKKGLVEQENGNWLANQVFFMPVEKEHIFSQFFFNFKVKFTKSYILMH